MKPWGCLLVVAIAALGVGVSASAQSLGEVARKEQQRRKTTTKTSGKTYTNRDLGPGGSQPSAPSVPPPASGQTAGPGGASTAARPAEQAEKADEKDPKQTEEYWRDRLEGAREELARNELFLEALQSRVNALSTDFVNRDDPYQRGVIANDRQKALAEMERTKTAIAKLKQQIADIEEEARQAGVPPGWIR